MVSDKGQQGKSPSRALRAAGGNGSDSDELQLTPFQLYRRSWRPTLGWSIVVIIILEFTVLRLPALGIPSLSETMVGLLLGTGLAAAATRSWDKSKGVAE